jgi:ribonucleoside-diphosphate reductase subunit M1
MNVVKRNKTTEVVKFDKIYKRLETLGKKFDLKYVNYHIISQKIIDQLYDGMHTRELDVLAAEQCASMITEHLDYGKMAGYICISNHHKETKDNYCEFINELYNNGNLISQELRDLVNKYKKEYQSMLDYERDYLIDFFGFKTLEKTYLININGNIERPQHMWLRVAISIHKNDLLKVKETYDMLSNKYFTHATPTLFNAGTNNQQLSSCFLEAMEDDSIEGIFNTLKDCALISKRAGGIGLHIHNIRATGSIIKGTNGTSNGISPMLKVFNSTARYVDQGGGKRNGSFAIYLEPHHPDIEQFLELKKNHGDEESKSRDLFYGLWISDLFMKRVENDDLWTLFCPSKCPGLSNVYGDAFETKYNEYENKNMGNKTIKAREVWLKILESQIETGTPYMLYKDAANKKSNQKNLGTIKSSNLCTEIIEYSNKDETAVCNLASIAVNMCVENGKYNHEKLHSISKIVTYNLNKIIDENVYPIEKCKVSNFLHRPIGIGIQGLADTFALLRLDFDSSEAKKLNEEIFATIYHGALEASLEISIERKRILKPIIEKNINEHLWQITHESKISTNYIFVNNINSSITELDKRIMIDTLNKLKPIYEEIENLNIEHCGAYSSFKGSPMSFGKFQFDLWGETPSDRYNWEELRQKIMENGIRNSLLMAPMPTAGTSQILGNNECIEPFTSNIYVRRVKGGDFIKLNKYLVNDLTKLCIWNKEIKDSIIKNNGSVQHLDIPDKIKSLYRTVWELKMKDIIDMSRDRGKYIDQSQSLNLWLENPTAPKLTSMHFYGWNCGLKTGMYYLRTKAKAKAQQFTIEPEKQVLACSRDNPDCLSCGS